MAPGAVFDLDDPHIGIVSNFTNKARFDIGFGCRPPCSDDNREYSSRRLRVFKDGLWRGAIQNASAVETVDLDVDGAGLIGSTSTHRRKGSFDVATAHIGRHPDAGFQSHRLV